MSLRDARGLLSWSQARLADESGENKSAIADLEQGRNLRPAYVLVMNIFRALQRGGLKGISVEDIFPLPTPPAAKSRRTAARDDDRRGQTTTSARKPRVGKSSAVAA